jgi:hypothetical protein
MEMPAGSGASHGHRDVLVHDNPMILALIEDQLLPRTWFQPFGSRIVVVLTQQVERPSCGSAADRLT